MAIRSKSSALQSDAMPKSDRTRWPCQRGCVAALYAWYLHTCLPDLDYFEIVSLVHISCLVSETTSVAAQQHATLCCHVQHGALSPQHGWQSAADLQRNSSLVPSLVAFISAKECGERLKDVFRSDWIRSHGHIIDLFRSFRDAYDDIFLCRAQW